MMTSEGPDGEAQKSAQRLLDRGSKLLAEGKTSEAIASLEQALELDPQSVPALINLGGAQILAGRHKKAIPYLEAARDAEPENPMIWINLAAAYLGNPVIASGEQQLRAISAFEKALKLDPAAPSVHYNLGLIFVDRGDSDLAAAAFRRALMVNPEDRDAHLWLRRLETDSAEGIDDG